MEHSLKDENFLSWLIQVTRTIGEKHLTLKERLQELMLGNRACRYIAYFIVSFLALLFSNPSAGFGDVVAIKTVWTIVNFAPRLAIIFRRLRDTGSSIWWAVAAVAGSTTKVIDCCKPTQDVLSLCDYRLLSMLQAKS